MRRKSMPVLSVPGALVGGDEVTMAVFHELSRAEGPSQQTGLTANFRQSQPEIHVSLVSPQECYIGQRKSEWRISSNNSPPCASASRAWTASTRTPVSYTHLRAH